MKICENGVVREATEEEIKILEETIPAPSKEQEVQKLKEELATYDYIGVKIAMGVATREEYTEQIAHTEQLRERIRELESED